MRLQNRIFALLLCILLLLLSSCENGVEDVTTDAMTDEPTESVEATTEAITDPEPTTASKLPHPELKAELDGLYTYDMMVEDIAALAAVYPDIFYTTTLGTTADGRDIYLTRIGSGKAERQIAVDVGTHAREYLNCKAMIRTIGYYLQGFETLEYGGTPISELFSRVDLYIIPMLNPDGVSLAQLGLDGIRSEALREGIKTMYENDKRLGYTTLPFERYLINFKANVSGTDLNRNYDLGALTPDTERKDGPSHQNYHGPAPLSEPESQAYAKLISMLTNPIAALSIHSGGERIFWHCGQEEPMLGACLSLAELASNVSGYYVSSKSSVDCASTDWCVLVKSIPAITVETGIIQWPMPDEYEGKIYTSIRDLFLAVAKVYTSK